MKTTFLQKKLFGFNCMTIDLVYRSPLKLFACLVQFKWKPCPKVHLSSQIDILPNIQAQYYRLDDIASPFPLSLPTYILPHSHDIPYLLHNLIFFPNRLDKLFTLSSLETASISPVGLKVSWLIWVVRFNIT